MAVARSRSHVSGAIRRVAPAAKVNHDERMRGKEVGIVLDRLLLLPVRDEAVRPRSPRSPAARFNALCSRQMAAMLQSDAVRRSKMEMEIADSSCSS